MAFMRGWRIVCALALLAFAMIATRAARAQLVIATVAGGGTVSSPPLANICLPVTAMTMYGGNIYFASCNQVWEEAPQGQLTLIAGTGAIGYSGDGGPARSATLNIGVMGLAVDSHGNVFIADLQNNAVREVAAATGIIQTVAGNGSTTSSGDGGEATSAGVPLPRGLAVDSSGDIFIVSVNVVREVTAADGNIQTIAGGGSAVTFVNGESALSALLQNPFSLFLDGSGNLYISDVARIYKMSLSAGTLTLVAGTGAPGRSFNSSNATLSEVYEPLGLFVDTAGNVYFADAENEIVQEVVAGTAALQVVFGNSTDGTSTSSTTAALNTPLLSPNGVFIEPAGNILVSDDRGIWESVTGSGAVTLLAGNSSAGYNGDGMTATSATLLFPQNATVDSSGNLLIADTLNARVREVRVSDNTIQTIAGDGTSPFSGSGTSIEPWGIGFGPGLDLIYATQHVLLDGSSQFDVIDELKSVTPSTGASTSLTPMGYLWDPNGVAVDSGGNIFFTDTIHNTVDRMVAGSASIETVAGIGLQSGPLNDGGLATNASLNHPLGVFVDSSGDIFIADTQNQRIREVFATTGDIQTVAGMGTAGFAGDGGAATSAELADPGNVVVDGSGNIFIADTYNNRVREVLAATGIIQTIAGTGVQGGSAVTAARRRPRN